MIHLIPGIPLAVGGMEVLPPLVRTLLGALAICVLIFVIAFFIATSRSSRQ